MKNIAVLLAGGVGSRVGASIPKQFIEIQGKPVLAYTIEKFQNHPNIDGILVVCHKDYMKYLEEYSKEQKYTKVKWIKEGGVDFQHSVLNGIYGLQGIATDNDIILVHFGASPFVTEDIISDAIKVAKEKGNAISTTPFYILSGVKTDEEKSLEYIDRDTIACMNSPHAFKYRFIKETYDEAIRTGIIDEVEPHTTTMMYKMGLPIFFSKGSQTNIKITTKEDLELFEAYVYYKGEKNAKK